MQRSRRTNPYPFTWEIPLAVAVGAVLLLVLGVHVGRAAANLGAGSGMTLPPREELFTSLVAVIRGDAGAGLTGTHPHLAGPTAVRIWVILTEALTLALMAWAGKVGFQRWGPGRIQGMATREEAEKLLGRSRLRRTRGVVRPDLYARQGQR